MGVVREANCNVCSIGIPLEAPMFAYQWHRLRPHPYIHDGCLLKFEVQFMKEGLDLFEPISAKTDEEKAPASGLKRRVPMHVSKVRGNRHCL